MLCAGIFFILVQSVRVQSLDFLTRKILDVGQTPHQISFSADGNKAYIAAAGSDRIAIVDVALLQIVAQIDVPNTPLGIIELPSGELAASQFRSDGLIRLTKEGGQTGEKLITGAGPSLFSGPFQNNIYLVSAERANRLWVLNASTFQLIRDYPTGQRPFPSSTTPDGKKAFVPNYNDRTVTVIDLVKQRVLATVAVGERPSGGAVRTELFLSILQHTLWSTV